MPFKRIHQDFVILTIKITNKNNEKLIKIKNKHNFDNKEQTINYVLNKVV